MICSPMGQACTKRTSTLNPLMSSPYSWQDSGKALARSGELLIDATSVMGLYGGGLSSAGANIRNAGDCVAQAAASCRFKTAAELVCDELREGATCLIEGVDKMKLAVEEARADKDADLAKAIGKVIFALLCCHKTLGGRVDENRYLLATCDLKISAPLCWVLFCICMHDVVVAISILQNR
mmetsp:Transcript_13898/g.40648  ORF Transcript_13898/g.40648 Transcript_13898/m.40648 type:complete len:181 (+) Transcript_13898:487-1029(+)